MRATPSGIEPMEQMKEDRQNHVLGYGSHSYIIIVIFLHLHISAYTSFIILF